MDFEKKISAIILLLLILFMTACNTRSTFDNNPVPADSAVIKGIAIFNKDENLVTEYIPKEKIYLGEISGETTENISVITSSGSAVNTTSDVYIGSDSSSIYILDRDNKIKDVEGIYLWENFNSITDAFFDAKNHLDAGEKIMVVLLDGFSLSQYKLAEERGYVSFLTQYFKHEALSVYTPVTNAGFAAMITGETPDVNGVHDRSFREMKVESIFGHALSNEKNTVLLEGDIKILNTEIEPKLHIDNNKDGDIDDEVFETTKIVAQEDYDLIFIHFHGIDDRGHNYGPESSETINYIKKIDSYMEEISNLWNGPIILTADHGMHKAEDGGNHGMCIKEDMVVPYFKKEQ